MQCIISGCDKQANFVPRIDVPAMRDSTIVPFSATINWPVCNSHLKEVEDQVTDFLPGLRDRIGMMIQVGARSATVHDGDRGEARVTFDREQKGIPNADEIRVVKVQLVSEEYSDFMQEVEKARPPSYTSPFPETLKRDASQSGT